MQNLRLGADNITDAVSKEKFRSSDCPIFLYRCTSSPESGIHTKLLARWTALRVWED
jgi:ATP-dependent helicase YprA (DUF1998 family)